MAGRMEVMEQPSWDLPPAAGWSGKGGEGRGRGRSTAVRDVKKLRDADASGRQRGAHLDDWFLIAAAAALLAAGSLLPPS
jgi:hypothetical protein